MEKCEDRIIFDIKNYFVVEIDGIPEIRDQDHNSVWLYKNSFVGIVTKDNFNKCFWDKLSHPLFGDLRYKHEVEMLKEQMEEFYGLYTAIILMQ